ncbi:alpha-amylase family glycosyl hydrolase [Paucibacter sp. Y2R2-4]|uniref:alpha-amylase family glycosyl hydrolase n=1 Tax=Paucibacter sp. Y2R2-4 TaxID=2893553 RepID=UPI0021E40713|nr:alpha-amylase family glycosyl hydrolase [Paucibacter sp. Y2R2-4]MCV2352061.1 alpha-amylase [Paucibacter sp. Y2R2-4]
MQKLSKHSSQAFAPLLLALSCSFSGAAAATPQDKLSNSPTTPAKLDLSPIQAQQGMRSALPAGWQNGAFMEIFVRGYQDSDGDGVGDLRGLIQRLDYLKDLGIKGIWLMPITASADRDHGYATTDFRSLEPQYGSLGDFDELIQQAHRRGIGIIIDYILNHAASQHPLFQSALQGESSPYRDWFVWQDPAPSGWDIWGKNPWYPGAESSSSHYFATFGPHMPDFNLRKPEVVDYHRSSLRFWLNRGLDGFRLDAVPHMIENDAVNWNDQPESRRLTKDFQDLIKSYPQRYTVCEATAEPKAYAAPEVCGSAFAFGLEQQILKAAKGEPNAIQQVADYFVKAPLSMATMLANHDIFAGERIWDQLAGDESRYKLAAATYLLLPGTPFIYYGEEIGMAGVKGLPGDEPLRAPMSWTHERSGFTSKAQAFRPVSPNATTHNAQAQLRDPGSILNFYKAMLTLRNRLPAIATGAYVHPQVQGQTLSFQRRLNAKAHNVVLINYGDAEQMMTIPALPKHAQLKAAYPKPPPPSKRKTAISADADGHARINVGARSVQVYEVLP